MTDAVVKNAIKLASKELIKSYNYLQENTAAWNTMHDLKMHYVAYMDASEFSFELNGATVTFSDAAINNAFQDWCSIELYNFKEVWAHENGIDVSTLLNYMCESSSFYIGGLYTEFFEDILTAVSDFDGAMIKLNLDGGVDYNRTIKEYDGDVDALVKDLLVIANNVYSDLESVLDEIIKVHNYIKDFKEHQCENFKAYVIDTWKNNL